MQPPQPYLARLEDVELYHNRYAQFNFELVSPNLVTFEAGQYTSVKVSPQGERRSYSICSVPDVTHQIQLLVDLKPMGVGSLFMKNLHYGDQVEMLMPMGRFVIPENLPYEHLVYIATGSGITPFKSMIEDQLRVKQTTKQVTLHWGMHGIDDLFWLEYWQELATNYPNFHFHPVISEAPPEWTLCRGRVTDCLSVHTLPANAAFFLCGNQRMIDDVTKFLTETKQLDSACVFTEKFY